MFSKKFSAIALASLTISFVSLSLHAAPIKTSAMQKNQPRYAIVMPENASDELKTAAKLLTAKHEKNGFQITTIKFAPADVRSALPALQDFRPYYTCFLIPKELAGRTFTVNVSKMAREILPDPYMDTYWGILTGADGNDIQRIAKFAGPIQIDNAIDMVGGFNHDVMKRCYSFDETQEKNLRVTDPKTNQRNEKTTTDKDFTELFTRLINEGGMQLIMTSGHATEHDWQSGYLSKNMAVTDNHFGLEAVSTRGNRVKLTDTTPKIWCAAGNCLIGNVPDGGQSCMALGAIHSLGCYQFMGYTIETWFGRQGWTAQGMLTEYPGLYTFNECFHFANTSIVKELNSYGIANQDVDVTSYNTFQRTLAEHLTGIRVPRDAKVDDIPGLLYDRNVVAFYGDPAMRAAVEPANGQTLSVTVQRKENVLKLTVKALKDGTWHGTGLYLSYQGNILAKPVVKSKNFDAEVLTGSCFAHINLTGEYHKGDELELVLEDTEQQALSELSAAMTTLNSWLKGLPPNSVPQTVLTKRLEQAIAKIPSERLKKLTAAPMKDKTANGYLAWLITAMPEKDLNRIDAERLKEDITYALQARKECRWRTQINEDLFLRYILPYWCVNESRDPWRKFFYTAFMPAVRDCKTTSEAVKKLNEIVFKELDVTYDAVKRPRADQSAMESITAHYASCTGLSVILINACRACGIPARFAGCARWTDQSGNHSWVEFWDDQWLYEGASSSDPRNRSWVGDKVKEFTSSAAPENDVLTITAEPKGKSHFILSWAPGDQSYPAVSIRPFYLDKDLKLMKFNNFTKNNKTIWIYYKGEPWYRLTPAQAAAGIEIPAEVQKDLTVYNEADAPGTFKPAVPAK